MGFKSYRLELDAAKHPVLVMQKDEQYGIEPLDSPKKSC